MSKRGVSRRGFLARSSAALVATASLPAATQAASAPRTSMKDRPMLWPAPFDVVVAGSGPSGIGAALASARMGAKTLLLERHAFLGGMAAWGLGMPMRQMRPGGRPRGNVHEALIARLGRYGPEAATLTGDAVVCNGEYLKVAVLDLLDEALCAYLTHTQIVDAIVKKDRVVGLVAATKRGLMHVESQVVVDATGDADVAAFAGAATMKGKEGDAYLSPMTLLILVANVDVEGARRFAREGNLKRLLEKAATKYPELPEKMVFEPGPHPLQQCLVVNHSGTEARGPLDGSSLDDMTEAERHGRRQAIQIVSALREFGGAPFARAQLAGTGPQIGVRDTRRVKGLYVLTEEDAKSGRHFDDAVAWRSGSLETGFEAFQEMKVHDVPYRALVPEKVDGLLAAGRCISVTHAASGAGRNMGNCMATGHAAGIAAALAATKHKEPRDIKAGLIREALAKDGVSMQPASAS